MTITPWLSQHLGNLVIPSGVAVADVSNSGSLRISGTLSDSGSLYVTSSNSSVNSVAVTAGAISVKSSGLISDIVPASSSFASSTTQSAAQSAVNLSLTSASSILNAGSITSSGAVNLTTGSGSVTNSGTVSSSNGAITIASSSPSTNLIVQGTGGTFSAPNNAINLNTSAYGGTGNTTLIGGNYLSQQLNFNGGTGNINASVGNMTGIVNANASTAHVTADTANLKLGTMNLSGDPTYFNTGGSVTLIVDPNATSNLAIVASQDIVALSNITATSGNITLVAGANFSSSGPASGTNDSSTTLTLHNSGSVTGGAVQVAGQVTTNGGNLIIASYGGSGIGSAYTPGSVKIGGTINTGGTKNNGNVTVIAGAKSGNGITTSDITSSGAGNDGKAGNITLITAAPVINGGEHYTIFNGTPSTNTPYNTTANTATFSAISTGNLLAAGDGGSVGRSGGAGGQIILHAGTTISTDSIRNYGGGGGGGDNITFNASGSGGKGGAGENVSLLANGNIVVSQDINSSRRRRWRW